MNSFICSSSLVTTVIKMSETKRLVVPPTILSKVGRNLHNQEHHPIQVIKKHIQYFFGPEFKCFDSEPPKVTIEENFDLLLIPKDHPSRSPSDTYYLDEKHVLRTQTSAHQNKFLRSGEKNFLVTGDVYRKDQVNATHYPVFHQMEGVCVMHTAGGVEVKDSMTMVKRRRAEHSTGTNSWYEPCSQPFTPDARQVGGTLVPWLQLSFRYRQISLHFSLLRSGSGVPGPVVGNSRLRGCSPHHHEELWS